MIARNSSTRALHLNPTACLTNVPPLTGQVFDDGMMDIDAYGPFPNAILFNWATIFVLGFGNLAALDFQVQLILHILCPILKVNHIIQTAWRDLLFLKESTRYTIVTEEPGFEGPNAQHRLLGQTKKVLRTRYIKKQSCNCFVLFFCVRLYCCLFFLFCFVRFVCRCLCICKSAIICARIN